MDPTDTIATANPPSPGLHASQPARTLDDPQVMQKVEEFLVALQQGHCPDRRRLLDEFPALADELAECLDALEFVQQATPQLNGQTQAGEASPSRLPTAGPRVQLGDFRILREIGRGGMGIVYEAEQISLRRRVALKVLPFAATLDGRRLERFKNEALAAARLHHSHIVPVYAVGCERGVYYYAMQMIEGLSLADVIAQWQRAAAPPEGASSPSVSSRSS